VDSQGSIAVNKQVSEEAIGGNQSCSCGVHVTDIIIRIPIFEKKNHISKHISM
jgi:N-methylhydantoinase B/oxoprolinase/acetone carboxylase alpha subunit